MHVQNFHFVIKKRRLTYEINEATDNANRTHRTGNTFQNDNLAVTFLETVNRINESAFSVRLQFGGAEKEH